MPLLTTAWLLDRYGARITMKELAEVLKVSPRTVTNKLSAGSLGIPTYYDSGRFVKAEDLAIYLDSFKGS